MSATILKHITSSAKERRIEKRLGDLLVDNGIVAREDMERAAAEAHSTGHRLGEVLIERSLAEERDVYRQLAELYQLRFSDVGDLLGIVDHQLAGSISRRFQEYNHLIPIVIQDNRLLVATSEPNASVADLASTVGARTVEVILITPTDYRRLRLSLDLKQSAQGSSSPEASVSSSQNLLASEEHIEAPVRELFQAILLDAIAERASDIHLEAYGDHVRVRIRVDGDLRDLKHFQLSKAQMLGVVSVAKVRANMDLAEHRVPQGGRFSVHVGDHEYDLRAQTQPALYGENLVLRLLPQDIKLLSITDLGFPEDLANSYRRLLDSPTGLILVVGPTGSGKSTTLTAGLQVLATESSRKVLTAEDPIEYEIEGVQQSQVRPEIGFSFANAMRAFVREDPDVILVGEIRDGETALEALRASQTGHLVLSTLHCNDAVDAVQRLFDLGMHPNSIASELMAVFAQRLGKRICESCKAPYTPSAEELSEIFPSGAPSGFVSFKGTGCSHCSGTGTHGRIAVVEYLSGSARVRRAIARRLSLDELREAALAAGLIPMRTHALELVQQGVISLEELPQMLTPEQLAPEPATASH
jgi:type IV pilus assembly protein PilB